MVVGRLVSFPFGDRPIFRGYDRHFYTTGIDGASPSPLVSFPGWKKFQLKNCLTRTTWNSSINKKVCMYIYSTYIFFVHIYILYYIKKIYIYTHMLTCQTLSTIKAFLASTFLCDKIYAKDPGNLQRLDHPHRLYQRDRYCRLTKIYKHPSTMGNPLKKNPFYNWTTPNLWEMELLCFNLNSSVLPSIKDTWKILNKQSGGGIPYLQPPVGVVCCVAGWLSLPPYLRVAGQIRFKGSCSWLFGAHMFNCSTFQLKKKTSEPRNKIGDSQTLDGRNPGEIQLILSKKMIGFILWQVGFSCLIHSLQLTVRPLKIGRFTPQKESSSYSNHPFSGAKSC